MTQEEIDKLIKEMQDAGNKVSQGDLFGFYGAPVPAYDIVKCECGGEKTYGEGAGIHSFWCPKYTKYY